MSANIGRIDTPTDAALAPFHAYAALMASAQQGAWAMGQAAASDAARRFMTLYAQQAQLALGWAEVAGKTLATLTDSKVVDELVQANVALARAQSRQALDAASDVIGRFDVDRLRITPFPIVGWRQPAASTLKPQKRRLT